MTWFILMVWGYASSVNWLIHTDYLPDKALAISNFSLGLTRYIGGIVLPYLIESIGMTLLFGILSIC